MTDDLSLPLVSKIQYLKEEVFYKLTAWEKQFIGDVYESIFDLDTKTCSIPHDTSDEDMTEYLSDDQIEKVNQIYGDRV